MPPSVHNESNLPDCVIMSEKKSSVSIQGAIHREGGSKATTVAGNKCYLIRPGEPREGKCDQSKFLEADDA